MRTVWFRGPHSDYLVDTDSGRLLLREPGLGTHQRGDVVTWGLTHSWPLRDSSAETSRPAALQ